MSPASMSTARRGLGRFIAFFRGRVLDREFPQTSCEWMPPGKRLQNTILGCSE